jgi:hypothetical protein
MEMSCARSSLVVFRSAPPRSFTRSQQSRAPGAVALLLLVGGAYWRGVLKRGEGEGAPLARVLRIATQSNGRCRAAWRVVARECCRAVANGWSRAVIAALACSALGSLEYVNYFRVQLQHFDHLADFKRLLGGRGFARPIWPVI